MLEKTLELPQNTLTTPAGFLEKKPAYIFHHFMKCGGSSVNHVLTGWFNMIYDHVMSPEEIGQYKSNRYSIENISSEYCIVGHFAYEGIFINQRYPEIITNADKIKAFTFIRNPLDFCISFYYYSMNNGRMNQSITEFFDSNRNLLAYFLPCDESNYKEVLDRYFFIGILENFDESINKLSKILNKPPARIPFLNKSEKDSSLSIITPDFIKKFRSKNKLDYEIYDYCLEKFSRI